MTQRAEIRSTKVTAMGRRKARRSWGAPTGVLLALVVVVGLATPTTVAQAASTDVVINELMFNAPSGVDGDEFLELANRGPTPVDVSGWTFSGITLTLPAATTIAAGGYLVVAKDAARFQLEYGFAPAAVYTGSLSNGGEKITVKDAGAVEIDSVTYSDRDPWPTVTDGVGPSLELIDSSVDNTDPVNWAASTAVSGSTPGAANSVVATGLKPHITAVAATPNVPSANQAITVTATVTGQNSVVVRSQVDFGAQQTTPMTDLGGNAFTATIPGAAAGHLIRYRVEATNDAGTNYSPRLDDSSPFKGVVAANGISSAIPVIEWFIPDASYNQMTANPTVDITRPAVIAYNGTVFDNSAVSIRGESSEVLPKVNWKIELPKNHDLTLPGLASPVDEFAMQADWSDNAHGRALLAWDTYAKTGVVNTQVFPVRAQRNGQFQGLYTYVDLFDGTWRDRTGYSDDQFFKAGHGAFDASRQLLEYRFEKKNPEDEDFGTLQAFLNGVDLTGTAQRDYLQSTANIPEMINYAVTTAVVQHVDSISKNFYLSQNGVTGRWEIIPWDLDHTFGNGCCGVNSPFVTPAEPGDQKSELMAALLAVPEWRDMYFRRLRTVVNDVLAPGKMEAIYDAKVGPAQPEATLDFAKWPRSSTGLTYAGQRTKLFSAIQARRNAFANDSRLPATQSAAPNIVINEIQHSPTGGAGAEYIELFNPSTTEAVDLSGWTLSGGITMSIQPGTVILPGGTMTFDSNDATFRATYGGTVFVGGSFTGDLAPSESLQLARADGSVADSVTYGGTGWPDASNGASLELVNPASDNSLGDNWALSTRSAGSPGAANQTAVSGNVPGAPTIGSVSAANAAATVAWTAPSNTGGSAITGYQIRVLDSVTQQVVKLVPAPRTASSLYITGLTNGVSYQFQVAANNAQEPARRRRRRVWSHHSQRWRRLVR